MWVVTGTMATKQRLTAMIDNGLNEQLRRRYHDACHEALLNKRNPPSFSAWFNKWLKERI